MSRLRFPFTSDQAELLLAFETAGSLAALADIMAKDASVVSRQLQRLAETSPVLEKRSGRWQITALGSAINLKSKKYLEELALTIQSQTLVQAKELCFSDRATLIVINAQAALLEPTRGKRSNDEAEKKIQQLLNHFRSQNRNVIHVKHVSSNSESAFFHEAPGVQFMPELAPLPEETVVEKTKASALAGTNLSSVLSESGSDVLILTGFTANDCIDATAREASELGFTVYVAGDATSMFDVSGPDGKWQRAERVHRLTLANLNALYAKVVSTDFLLQK